MQGVLVSCLADPHTSVNAANDPALMAIYRVGPGHLGFIPQGCQKILVSVRHRRQVHKVAGSNPFSQDQ
jgi:hypothetical protein